MNFWENQIFYEKIVQLYEDIEAKKCFQYFQCLTINYIPFVCNRRVTLLFQSFVVVVVVGVSFVSRQFY